MNARSQNFEFSVEGSQISEVVSSMFHTILFHRCVGKVRKKNFSSLEVRSTFSFQYHTKGEESYSVGTLGFTDVDCNFIDFTYVSFLVEMKTIERKISFSFVQVQVTSQELQRNVADKITQFHNKLRSSDGKQSGQVRRNFQQRKGKTFLSFR